ncbi:MAG: hypothetical protein RIT27_2064 [Pseudomonadota bacterium]|jgi:nitric oxide reductase NorE protein
MTTAPSNPTHLPGDLAIWIFIFAELLVFGILFLAFAFARKYHLEMFNNGQLALVKSYGALNTLVLITSSYFVVKAVSAIRENLRKSCVKWLSLSLMMGSVFIIVKIIEYYEKVSAGYDLETNLFFMFYFVLTFFHFMHVMLGMIILGVVLIKTQRGDYSAENHTGIETGASYWHMVDLVWVILFPLVYVMR